MLSSNLFFFHLGGYYQKGEIETNVNNFFCVLRTPSQVPQLPEASGLEIGMGCGICADPTYASHMHQIFRHMRNMQFMQMMRIGRCIHMANLSWRT